MTFLISFPTSGNIVAKTKFASRNANMFSKQIQKHFCCGNNVFKLARMFPARETLIFRLSMRKTASVHQIRRASQRFSP